MKIKFTGVVDLPYADDHGTYDGWLVSAIDDAISRGPELDDVFTALNLSWEIVE